MSIEESLRIVPKGEIALLEWDLVNEKVNKMSSPVMARFQELIEEVGRSEYKALIIISRKKRVFIAGADINEIKGLKTKEDVAEAVGGGQKILNLVEDLRIPVIAAIHGACMGGGCELALACDYRIATDEDVTRIGLPETLLGIIPGFGGCVRLPRIVGVEAALDIILNGKAVPAPKAKKIGMVDRLVSAPELEQEAIRFARKIIQGGGAKRRKRYEPASLAERLRSSALMKPIVFKMARKKVLSATKGHYPAPLKALEVVQKTHGMNPSQRDEALRIEREGFCEVAVTEVSKNLIEIFFLQEAIKGRSGVANKDIRGREVHSLAVLGAGTMGGGIAYVAADKGIFVRMKDINDDALERGFNEAKRIWKKQIERRRLNRYQMQERLGRIKGVTTDEGMDQVDVVIEAIVENMDIKKKVIADLAQKARPDCIFATNTSSLSVTEMAKAHPRPENFVGMHFFNPVNRMPLVEVIRGEHSSDETTATIFELSKKMGKIPVVVKDSPGFLVNRLLIPYLMEAAFLLEEGQSIENVDNLIANQFGMPMGPFHLMDEIGLDVCIKVSHIFRESLGERMQVPEAMEKLAKTDRLGKKNRKGFYKYDERGKKLEPDSSIYGELGLEKPKDPFTAEEVIGRCIYNMINEAALVLLEEKVVGSAGDLDLAMIMGTGFPPFRGGLLRYADSVGVAKVADELEVLAAKYGQRLKPTTPLAQMAKTDRKFYG